MPNSQNEAYEYLEERFGVTREDLEPLELRKINGDFWLAPEENDLQAETAGIRALRSSERGFKPTTYFLQLLGDRISKNAVELSDEEYSTILDREMIEKTGLEKGYVALIYEGDVIGCGFFKNELVSTRISKARTKHLVDILDM